MLNPQLYKRDLRNRCVENTIDITCEKQRSLNKEMLKETVWLQNGKKGLEHSEDMFMIKKNARETSSNLLNEFY